MSTKYCTLRILDEVNCCFVGLHPDHLGYLSQEYAVFAANYFFNPKFKLGKWDGKIRYFYKTGMTFVNLLDTILPRVIKLGYKVKVDDLRTIDRIRPPDVTEDFFHEVINPRTNEPWKMRDYQIELVNTLFDAGNGIAIAGTGAGKAQSLNSKVLTPTGWRRMGDLKLTDKIITPSGDISTIVGVYPQGKKQLFKLTFHDGSSTLACKEHLWAVKYPKQLHKAWTETKIISTEDMINFLIRKKSGLHTPGNISIPLCEPTEHTEQILPIHPYLLGALLGDGCLGQPSVLFSNTDIDILNYVSEYIKPFNVKLTRQKNSDCDYAITKIDPHTTFPPTKNNLKVELEKLHVCHGAKNKFVPILYKQGSISQRLQILQGLMDTDGTVDKRGNISFTSISKQLAQDVQELVWSLGGTCTITSRIPTFAYLNVKKKGQLAYTCFIAHKTPTILFKCLRKINRCKQLHGDGRIELTRRLVNIEPHSIEEAQCIMIDDPNHLYITDNYIVTHNTSMCAALALSYENEANFRSLIVVPDKNLTDQTREQYALFGLDVGEYSGSNKDLNHMHVVSTWQSLKNNPILIQDFQTIIVDECHGLKGNVLTKLLNEYGKKIPYRFGVTGTLPKEESDKMSVIVAVGSVKYNIPAHQLIEEGHLAELQIDIQQTEVDLTFQYKKYIDEKDFMDTMGKPRTYQQFCDSYFPDYPSEKRYLQQDDDRLDWIKGYIESKRDEKKGNTLILVDGVSFGKKLTGMIDGAIFLYGKDKMKARKKVYDAFKTSENLVVIATVQIASTGLDIPRIFHMMGIDLGKSFIRIIQSIGRGLRKADDKDKILFSDICSNLKYGKKHLRERKKIYSEAKYPFTKYVVDLATINEYGHSALK